MFVVYLWCDNKQLVEMIYTSDVGGNPKIERHLDTE